MNDPRADRSPSTSEEIPHDVAAWIDERDPEPAADHEPTEALGEQRSEHEPDERDANDEVGSLINNTGDDGGAATG